MAWAAKASAANDVHRALMLAWRDDPDLRRDPQWLLRHYDAYEALHNACEAYEACEAREEINNVRAEPIA